MSNKGAYIKYVGDGFAGFYKFLKKNYNNKRKIISIKNFYQRFNNQSTELNSSSEIDNIIQKGEVIFKKNLTAGLPELSKLINSAISKKQGDQRKHSFLEKKNTH